MAATLSGRLGSANVVLPLQGYRVIAHDRRGHGRSTQVADGHDLDHDADDLKAVTDHLNLKDAIHVGHSTGGGEVVRYLARHGDKECGEGCHHQRRAAVDGEDPGQSARPTQIGVRRSPSPNSSPTGPSFITICRPARSTASTVRA